MKDKISSTEKIKILEQANAIEHLINLAITFHYFGRLEKSFLFEVLCDEYMNFGIRINILSKAYTIKKEDIDKIRNTIATTTKHIFAGDLLVATIEGVASTTYTGEVTISTSTPTFIQSKDSNTGGPVVLNNPVTAGNLIVVGVVKYGTTIPNNAITDNKGNVYSKVVGRVNGQNNLAIFCAWNVVGGSTFTVSASVADTISVHEYSGVSTYWPQDKFTSSTGTSAAPTSGNVVTRLGNELYFGLAWSGGNNNTWTAGYGYTKREEEINNTNYKRLVSEDKVISTSTTTPANFVTSGSATWIAAIATFEPLVTLTPVTGTTTAAGSMPRYIHTDHLGGTNVVTTASSTVIEISGYYPYGAQNLEQRSEPYSEQRKYIGQEYDESTKLNYLNARYYDGVRGQFISEDPMFWSKPNLTNPQAMNSYSYSEGNPIIKSDPSGLASYGFSLGISGDLGAGFNIGSTANFGFNFVRDNNTGKTVFAITYTRGFTYGIQNGPNISEPKNPSTGGTLGAAGGFSATGSYSPYTNNINELSGVSQNKTVNSPVTLQTSTSNGLVTYSAGLGVKVFGSVSNYPTQSTVIYQYQSQILQSISDNLAKIIDTLRSIVQDKNQK